MMAISPYESDKSSRERNGIAVCIREGAQTTPGVWRDIAVSENVQQRLTRLHEWLHQSR